MNNVSISVGVALIICLVLTFVILILVVTKMFRNEQSIDNLDYIETPKPSDTNMVMTDLDNDELGGGGERPLSTSKVHPETDYLDPNSNKRVLFRESGPQFIHDRPQSQPENGNNQQNNRGDKRPQSEHS